MGALPQLGQGPVCLSVLVAGSLQQQEQALVSERGLLQGQETVPPQVVRAGAG